MAQELRERAMAAPAQQQDNQPTLGGSIQKMESQFQLAMPKGLEAQQLVRDALTCLRQTPKLAECDQASVLGSLMTCAQLGLRPGVLGQAYLLPLWNGRNRRTEAQLIIGYQGLLELIYRSGAVSMVAARVVHANDEFTYEYGLEEDKLIHRPPSHGPRGEAIAYYAIARMKGGGYAMTDVMTKADMEQHRDKYAMAKKRDGTIVGPWVTQFDEMARKTMIRQLAKMLPKSPEVVRAITHDGAVRVDYTAAGIDADPATPAPDAGYIDGTVEPEEQPAEEPAQDDDVAPEPEPEPEPEAARSTTQTAPKPTKTQLTKLSDAFTRAGFAASDGSRDEFLTNMLGGPATLNDLSVEEYADVLNQLDTIIKENTK